MAVSGNIANGVISIVIDGFARVQSQMNSLKIQGNLTIMSAQKAGNAASNACKDAATSAGKATSAFGNFQKSILALSGIFAVSSVAVRSFAAAADPKGALDLQIAFIGLSAAIGRQFLPIIKDVTVWVNKATQYLNSMSNETRESILHWTKLGLAVTGGAAGLAGVGKVGSTVVGGLSPLVGVLSNVGGWLWRILGFLGPWGRLITIVGGLAVALFAANSASKDLSGTMGKLVTFFRAAWDTLEAGWNNLVKIVTPVVNAVERVCNTVFKRVFDSTIKYLGILWTNIQRVGVIFAKLFNINAENLIGVFAKLGDGIDGLIGPINAFFDFVDAGLDKAAKFYDALFAGGGGDIFGGIEKQIPALMENIEALKATFLVWWESVSSMAESVGKLFGSWWGAFSSVWGAIMEAVGELLPLWLRIHSAAMAVWNGINNVISTVIETIFGVQTGTSGLLGMIQALYKVVAVVFNYFAGKLAEIYDWIAVNVGPAIRALTQIAKEFGTEFMNVWDNVWSKIETFAEKMHDKFQTLVFDVKYFFMALVNDIAKAMEDMIKNVVTELNSMIKIANKLVPDRFKIPDVPEPQGEFLGRMGAPEMGKNWQEKRGGHQPLGADGKPATPPVAPPAVPPTPAMPVAKPSQEKMDEKFQGQALGKATFLSIVDVMRKAQESTVESPETASLRAIYAVSVQQRDLLEGIAKKPEVKIDMGLPRGP